MASRTMAAPSTLFESAVGVKSQVPGLGTLVGMELRKLIKRPMAWVLMAVLIGAFGIFFFAGYLVSNAQGKLDQAAAHLFPPSSIENMMTLPAVLGLICAAVLAAGIVGSEFGWGTMRGLVASGVPRSRLLGAKAITAAIGILSWFVIGSVVGFVFSLAVNLISGRAVSFGTMGASWWGDLGLMIVRTGFVLLVPLALGFAAAVVGRSLAAGIAVPVLWQVFEQVLGGVTGFLGHFGTLIQESTIVTNTRALMVHNSFGPVTVEHGLPSETHAIVVFAVYIVVLMAISFVVFQLRDMTSSS